MQSEGSHRDHAAPPRILIADTTLRDEALIRANPALANATGFDAPRWRMDSLTDAQMADAALALSRMKIDVLEVGFPARFTESHAAVQIIARRLMDDDVVVSALTPVDGTTSGIDATWTAVRDAGRPRIHLYTVQERYADETGHLLSRHEILSDVQTAVEHARSYTSDIEFSPPQGGVEIIDVIADTTRVAIAEGATTINIRGVSQPTDYASTYAALIAALKAQVPELTGVVLSADIFSSHLRGLEAARWARDSVIAAVAAGCRQVKCAVHGVAATPGFARLEELTMSSRVSSGPAVLPGDVRTDHRHLLSASDLMAGIKGYSVHPTDELVGTALRDTSPRHFHGPPWERESAAALRASVLRELGLRVPEWLEKSSLEWPLDPRSGP